LWHATEMPDASVVEWIRHRYLAVMEDLDECGRRRWAGAEARSLGWSGVSAVAQATGLSHPTVRAGVRELDAPEVVSWDRQRRVGGGRQAIEVSQPEIVAALERIVDCSTRGDPMLPLRWVCKSTRSIAEELSRQGFTVSHTKVAELLRENGYSLQANRKTIEGKQHPDRNAQFEHISQRVAAYLLSGQPAFSVDTKK
jgi:hypothetical protein